MDPWRVVSVFLTAVALLVAGCGGGGGGGKSVRTQAPNATGPASGSTQSTSGVTTISGSEFKFTPKAVTVTKGTTITFKNAGTIGHDLKLRKAGKVVAGTSVINAGQSATLKLNLPPGQYQMFCSVPGHEQSGMKGTLTIK